MKNVFWIHNPQADSNFSCGEAHIYSHIPPTNSTKNNYEQYYIHNIFKLNYNWGFTWNFVDTHSIKTLNFSSDEIVAAVQVVQIDIVVVAAATQVTALHLMDCSVCWLQVVHRCANGSYLREVTMVE